jgi:hypothetical protein
MQKWLLITLLAGGCAAHTSAQTNHLHGWPELTRQSLPWTRWWWMGSAVDQKNLTQLLHQYHDAGIGGVEICPIYGVQGEEGRELSFLSPQWMQMLDCTTATAHELGMGVDMTTGTGWPFGGPGVSEADASSTIKIQHFDVAGGTQCNRKLTSGRFQAATAISATGDAVDLSQYVKGDALDWTAPAGAWKVYVLLQHGPAMKVKRAAPGGNGNVVDPFSAKAMDDYLAGFDKAFAQYKGTLPDAQFHDSYEYVGDWTSDLLDQFKTRRGYDLRTQLPAFAGDGPPDVVGRVLCDYRQTMAELHMEYIARWVKWSHAHHMLAREQAHGAPANLLDLYALADIAETENFGSAGGDENTLMKRFASSAGHIAGRPMISAESFTWLGEHFQVSLADLKPAADDFFLAGINRLVYHGMAYSPSDAAWPGWLFYAAVDFNPNGGLWHDLPAFNAYVARCQSILQAGRPANDVLLYFPVYDLWQTPRGKLIPFEIGGKWLRQHPFYDAAMHLQSRGYALDYVSDDQISKASVEHGAITINGSSYRTIVIPHCQYMPLATLQKLLDLAKGGAKIVVQDALPTDVPGIGDLKTRSDAFRLALARFQMSAALPAAYARASSVPIQIGADLDAMLGSTGVQREAMADLGLRCIRRSTDAGYDYFIVNRDSKPFDGFAPLGTRAESAELLDPLNADRIGLAALKHDPSGQTLVYLQLQPGQSCILQTFANETPKEPAWAYNQPAGDARSVGGAWNVNFIEGGPALPAPFQTASLYSWTHASDPQAANFSGTARYTIDFPMPAGAADDWMLDLGDVRESARVYVNDQDAGTLFFPPFQVRIGKLLHPGQNHLEIEVTNLAANRIADLDRRGVVWKKFDEINFVGKDYHPFDASHWQARDSGLLGPVKLEPRKSFSPN